MTVPRVCVKEGSLGGPLIVGLFAGPGGAPDECWEGAGSDNGNGYRTVRVNGRNAYLHKEVMPNG